jgi:hypothetical protein
MKPTRVLLALSGLLVACAGEDLDQTGAIAREAPGLVGDGELSVVVPRDGGASGYVDESDFVAALRARYPGALVDGTTRVFQFQHAGSSAYQEDPGFNVTAAHEPVGFTWSQADREDPRWWPQGIAGAGAEAPASLSGGTQRRLILASWYAKNGSETGTDFKGVRVAVADVTSLAAVRYGYALLVQQAANMGVPALFDTRAFQPYQQGADIAPVPIHAGGIEVAGSLLFVADTNLGVRVFDLDSLLEASSTDGGADAIGSTPEGLVAFGYRYLLPEVGHYALPGGSPYSSLSQAEEDGGQVLVAGQYLTPSMAGTPTVRSFRLHASDGGALRQPALSLEAATSVPVDTDGRAWVNYAQGTARSGGDTWSSITGQSMYERSNARLVRSTPATPGTPATATRYRWPYGAEDLYLERSTGYLWSLTEHPRNPTGGSPEKDRVVFGVKLSTYQ